MKRLLIPLVLAVFLIGCAIFGSWKAIPPPGGCDQCHKLPISNDWQVAITPVTLHDERGGERWQKPASVLPPEGSPLEQMKVTEERCFRCHKGPDQAHVEYKGRYHH